MHHYQVTNQVTWTGSNMTKEWSSYVFKICHGDTDIKVNSLFMFQCNTATSGHIYKLSKQPARVNARKFCLLIEFLPSVSVVGPECPVGLLSNKIPIYLSNTNIHHEVIVFHVTPVSYGDVQCVYKVNFHKRRSTWSSPLCWSNLPLTPAIWRIIDQFQTLHSFRKLSKSWFQNSLLPTCRQAILCLAVRLQL